MQGTSRKELIRPPFAVVFGAATAALGVGLSVALGLVGIWGDVPYGQARAVFAAATAALFVAGCGAGVAWVGLALEESTATVAAAVEGEGTAEADEDEAHAHIQCCKCRIFALAERVQWDELGYPYCRACAETFAVEPREVA